jgi:transposase-like protein
MLLASSVCGLFKWRQFEPEVILLAVGWYPRFSLSYRDVVVQTGAINLTRMVESVGRSVLASTAVLSMKHF